jgi:predicted DNA-binding WGR domain protein
VAPGPCAPNPGWTIPSRLLARACLRCERGGLRRPGVLTTNHSPIRPTMIVLIRHDPAENVNRWYAIGVQPTLFCQYAVLCGWGRRGSSYARWRILPAENHAQASEMAKAILAAKKKKGYQVARNQGESPMTNSHSKQIGTCKSKIFIHHQSAHDYPF